MNTKLTKLLTLYMIPIIGVIIFAIQGKVTIEGEPAGLMLHALFGFILGLMVEGLTLGLTLILIATYGILTNKI